MVVQFAKRSIPKVRVVERTYGRLAIVGLCATSVSTLWLQKSMLTLAHDAAFPIVAITAASIAAELKNNPDGLSPKQVEREKWSGRCAILALLFLASLEYVV